MIARLSKLPWVEIGILALAAVLRLVLLDIKPAHFDEGVNGWFVDQMTRQGFFRYDPGNYHGPLHFYALFLSQTLFGRNLWALRLPAVVASLLAIWALLRYREFFGPTVARIAALAMAVSPAFVFYGRYSIHESWQVFFSILFLWGGLGLWQKGEARFVRPMIFAVAGLILTKETYLIHLGSFALAAGVLWLWQFAVPSRPAYAFAKPQWTRRDLVAPTAISLVAIVFFYSGNFLAWSSLQGLYLTFQEWFKTGVESAGHAKTTFEIGRHLTAWLGGWKPGEHSLLAHVWSLNYYWVALMARYEWPALAGLVACLRYVAPSDARLRYIAIAGGGVLVAYSIVPYKTPWCVISMIWPFYLILGGVVAEIAAALPRLRPPVIVPAAAAILVALSLAPSIRLNFFHFTDQTEPYVYVQTHRDVDKLLRPLLENAAKDTRYYYVQGHIYLDSYYPLPWVLGDFTRIGYYKLGENPRPATPDADFIVAEKKDAQKIAADLTGRYYRIPFLLRDAHEECIVFFNARSFHFPSEPENFGSP